MLDRSCQMDDTGSQIPLHTRIQGPGMLHAGSLSGIAIHVPNEKLCVCVCRAIAEVMQAELEMVSLKVQVKKAKTFLFLPFMEMMWKLTLARLQKMKVTRLTF